VDRPLKAAAHAPARVAVVGAGWAGLAAAVQAVAQGHAVTVFEMAAAPGGRARRAGTDEAGLAFDNGQHILIGAYAQCLRLMQLVGVNLDSALLRTPLRLLDAQGRGLALPAGAPVPALLRGLVAARQWPLAERLRLLAAAGTWTLRRFQCPPGWSVARLTASLPARIRHELIDPLCVAALNTPAAAASAQVFLRVLKDALFSAPGASDLLLPRQDLSCLFPEPAAAWLAARGAELRWRSRVQRLLRADDGWLLEGEAFAQVILATPAAEAARLAEPHAPAWAATAGALHYEPIVSVLLASPGTRLPEPMLALASDARQPAQFVFDLGALRLQEPAAQGVLNFVISGAAPWVAAGQDATAAAVLDQARLQLAPHLAAAPTLLRSVAEKRATFACTPGLARAAMRIAPGLLAAGDHVHGPYPATLEGAVRSGVDAAQALAPAG
jgi:squalene-associated FAD-dependent desaturase